MLLMNSVVITLNFITLFFVASRAEPPTIGSCKTLLSDGYEASDV